MRAHIVENGIVTNTIEVESLDFMPGLIEATDGGIGWSYINGIFIDNRPVTAEPVQAIEPTKEQLLSELAALTEKIRALK